ncbi:hypothetical protein N0V82_000835 [Gnomoniopsis sp. IMI 355080]|nr:hypothetical protein N0V82_000835 [Gnomoniopsis sp. IMI 355080]
MKFLGGFAVAVASLLLSPISAHSRERNPIRNVGHINDPVFQTPSNRVHAYSSFQLTFTLSDRPSRIRLSLEPNHDVVADGATVTYLDHDGSIQRTEPIDRLDHRVFKGTTFVQYPGDIEWTNAGWARIHVLQDGPGPIFEGAFALNGDYHHVQTSGNYLQTRLSKDPEIEYEHGEYMIVWRDSDIISDESVHQELDELKRSVSQDTCASGELLFNRDENHPIYRGVDIGEKRSIWSSMSPRALFGRQIDGTTGGNSAGVNLTAAIGSTNGCPTSRKVALIGVATDCTYTADFANDTAVRTNIINQVNTASQLYESTFNISLGIQNLTISPRECPSTASVEAPWNIGCDGSTLSDRLNAFSEWRGQHNDTNAYWTLMSTCNTDSAVGLAWLGQLCMSGSTPQGNETIAAANVVVRTSTEWQVFAHESGHTFGAVHDCTATTCADGSVTMQQCCPLSTSSCNANGQFIMNPSTSSGISQFSQCSIGNICSALGRQSVQSTCLTNNKDVVTITGSQCGNGIVESGEECDCGGDAGCAGNTCCDANTCKFTTGSVCDSSNEDCCTSSCQFASSGTVCRASTGVCDPQETCTGNSSTCPADLSAPDGTGCGSSLQCASGQCTSRDQQCQSLMGSLTTDNDTESCSSSGCQISCQSPSFGNNVCYRLNQNFLDGTPCQGGGKCSNGNCEGSNTGDEIKSWIEDNKNIVIPVASVVGGLILVASCSCIWSMCRRSRARRRRVPRPKGYGHVPSPPPMAGHRNVSSSGRSHRSRSSRPSRASIPLPKGPPPAYTGYQSSMATRYA